MDYWKRRDLIERVRLFNLTEDEIRKLLKREYLRVYKEVRTDLLDLINTLPPTATADQLYREDKFFKLLSELQYKLDNLALVEKDLLEQTFSNYYISNASLIGEDVSTLPVDNARVLKAINSNWAGDGKNFSDRIWSDKRNLLNSLQQGILDTIATGKNWGELSKKIQRDFGTSYNNSRRLVRTELSHIQNISSLDKYQAEGVQEVRYVAENDCCEDCRQHNGKVFDIIKAPAIPVHPNCRCTYIPVVQL